MSQPIRVPDLEKKVHLLLRTGRNAALVELKDIADALPGKRGQPLRPNNFSTYWFPRSSIPQKHFRKFCDLFTVPGDVLLGGLLAFEEFLANATISEWSIIANAAFRSNAISIRRSNRTKTAAFMRSGNMGPRHEPLLDRNTAVTPDGIVWTEGKSDWFHIQAAHRHLNVPYGLSFGGTASGNQNLLRQCQALALAPQLRPTIFIFDRDDLRVLHAVTDPNGSPYRDWGNNVYSIALPVPPHRQEEDGICIELYYRDEELTTANWDGSRLFLSSEFNQKSGRHKSNPDLSVGVRKNLPESDDPRIRIVDSDVFNTGHQNVALSKTEFAENIFNAREKFGSIGFAGFQQLFDLLGDLLTQASITSWSGLTDMASASDAIRVTRPEARGLIGPVGMERNEEGVEHLRVGERVWLELDVSALPRGAWETEVSHAVLLNVAPNEAICLCPNDRLAPNCRLSESRLLIPDPELTNEALEVYGPTGPSTIYALLTCEPVVAEVYTVLGQPLTKTSLDRLAREICGNLKKWRFIKKDIYVG